MNHVRHFAQTAPILAAVLAPFSILLETPSVTEAWYTKDGISQPDPSPNLILSGIGLAFSIIANALLIVRFSTQHKYWRITTWLSVLFWVVKVAISTGNLLAFGIITYKDTGTKYAEGFWCAIVSDATGVVIVSLLLLNFLFDFLSKRKEESLRLDVLVYGRHFMLQATLFVALIAAAAVTISYIEGWTYLIGVYFIVVSFLTIGFGDFLVTKTSSRILLFPFCLLGIALLGSLLGMMINFFNDRAAARRALSRAEFERHRQIREDEKRSKLDPDDSNATDLGREIAFLQKLNDKQNLRDEIKQLIISFVAFFAFWLIGAGIFAAIEGWSYGKGLYFGYVFFLTTGYGDVTPVTPAGRVIFIVYALLVVPIVAAYAVQTVTQVITHISTWRLNKRDATVVGGPKQETPPSHSDYVERFSRKWEETLMMTAPRDEAAATRRELDEKTRLMLREMIRQGIELQERARRLLIKSLPDGSMPQVLLKADRNVQQRDLRKVRRKYNAFNSEDRPTTGGEKEERREEDDQFGDVNQASEVLGDDETLDEVNRFRESFAAFLAAASRMEGLEGRERYLMERRDGERVDEGSG